LKLKMGFANHNFFKFSIFFTFDISMQAMITKSVKAIQCLGLFFIHLALTQTTSSLFFLKKKRAHYSVFHTHDFLLSF